MGYTFWHRRIVCLGRKVICWTKKLKFIWCGSLNTKINGARGESLEELLTVFTEYSIQWSDSRVDLAELAKLRYIEGWSRKQLATHYNRSLWAISNYFQNIRKKNFNLPNLKPDEKLKIKNAFAFKPTK